MVRTTLLISALLIAPPVLTYAADQPAANATQIISTQIGNLVLQNAQLQERVSQLSTQIDDLQKQVSDLTAKLPKPTGAK